MARERVEFDVVGKDSGSKAFRDVGDAAASAADQIDKLGDTATDAGEQVEKLGEKTERTGDQAGDAGEQYRGLAADIAETKVRMRELAEEINRTGNMDLAKDINRQRRELRKLTNIQKLMEDAGADGAEAFSVSFSQRIGPLLLRAPLTPVLVGAAVTAAPFVANVIAGAVTGAIGGGAVAAGIALAARDSQVQAEATALGAEIGDILTDAAKPFVPATLNAIGIVRDEIRDLDDDFEAIFADAAEYVEPLVRGATGFVREMVPGIRDAVAEGEPFFTMLSEELPELGADAGELFSTMAKHADDGAEAVGQMLDLMGALADTTGVVIDGFSFLKDIGNLDPTSESHWSDKLFGKTEGKFIQLKKESDDAAGGIRNVRDATSEATAEFESLSDAINRMSNENISAERASIALEEAIDRATEAAEKNGDGIDRNDPKQRANRQALLGIADAAWQAHDKILKQTGSQDLANEATDRGRKKFLETADAMGVEEKQAEELANQLFGIPNINRTVNVDNDPGIAAVNEFMRKYREIKDRSVTIHGYVRWTSSGLKVPGGTILEGMSDGGRVGGSGPAGIDSEPRLLAPDEYVLRGPIARAIGYDKLDALNAGQPVALGAAGGGGGRMAGGIDYHRLADAVVSAQARHMSRLTLVLDDRTGRGAELQARGG